VGISRCTVLVFIDANGADAADKEVPKAHEANGGSGVPSRIKESRFMLKNSVGSNRVRIIPVVHVVCSGPKAHNNYPHKEQAGKKEHAKTFPNALELDEPAGVSRRKGRVGKARHKGNTDEEYGVVQEVGPEAHVMSFTSIYKVAGDQQQQSEDCGTTGDCFRSGREYKVLHLLLLFRARRPKFLS
jgi:hypothetical protein